jgi:DNA-binding CsgD family transcriptional regulator
MSFAMIRSMDAASASMALVGRGTELDLLRGFVERAGEGPGAILLTGEAGIGKTALWRYAVGYGRRSGAMVMTARPSQEEMLGALVGLSDLIDLSRVDPDVLQPDLTKFARGRRLLEALRRLADETPVIVAIDDLQWLDLDSARTLRYVFRRLDDERIRLLATWRVEIGAEPPASPLAVPHASVETCHLGPLGRSDLRRLLAVRWGSVSPLTLRSIHEVTNGNPLYAIEVARSLSKEERRMGISHSTPLPRSLAAAIDQQLAEVNRDLRPIVELIAVAGRVTLSEIEAHLPGSVVGELLAEGRRQGLLATDEKMRIHFAHPVLALAVEQGMDPVRRRSLHGSLAEEATSTVVRARHLALATDEPDGLISGELEEAARASYQAGSPGMSAEFARHSTRLTPIGDYEAIVRRMLLEADGRAAAGDASGACALYDEVIAVLPAGPDRALALLRRFYVENDDLDLADAMLVRAIDDAANDRTLRGRVLDILGWHRGVVRGDLRGAIATAQDAVATLDATDDATLHGWAQAHLAHLQALAGHPQIKTMERLVEQFDTIEPPDLGGGPRAWLAKQRLWNGDLAGSRRDLDMAIADHHARGFTIGLPYRCYDMALLHVAAGDFGEAERWARNGLTVARDAESGDVEGWLLYPLAVARAWRGDHAGAIATATELLTHPSRPGGSALGEVRALSAIGLAELSRNDAHAATAALAPAVVLASEIGVGHPGALPVLSDAATAHAANGDLVAARAVADQLSEQVATLGVERVQAMAQHAMGAIALADGAVDTAVGTLTAAQQIFDRLGLRPDAARCVLLHGRTLLRAGRRNAAAAMLREARDRFEALGAGGWAAVARRELDRAQPGASSGALTDTESRIAALVASGSKNREIAATLFVSVATVEAHLTRLYRKLGIRSRTELAARVIDRSLPVRRSRSDARHRHLAD